MARSIITALEAALGALVVTEPDAMEPFSTDESTLGRHPPDVVVRPTTPEEIRIVLRLAAEHRVPVTPRGAGTGKSGGALPVRGGVLLSTDRMQKIYEVDEANRIAVVEPGVITGTLQARVEEEGLFYPPDPASLDSCSLGGNVAENAGGPRAYRYGVTREYVLGLEVALLGGDRLVLGRRSPKGVSGYDLTALVVGSEGTLAVIDRITLRLLPRPRAAVAAVASFGELGDASRAVVEMGRSGLLPSALELLDGVCVDHIREGSAYRFPEGAKGVLLVELDGDPERLEIDLIRCAEACEASGAMDVRLATDELQRRRLWEARRMVSEALKAAHRHKSSDDIAVPVGEMHRTVAEIAQIGERHELLAAVFGHAGDGNLHVSWLCDDEDPRLAARRSARARLELVHHVLGVGGTLSGEHGIGLRMRKYMVLEHPPQELQMMRAIKKLWDPLDLLNPGKLLPEPY